MADAVGLYLVDIDVSTNLAGAPTLHLNLMVNAPTGHVTGSGKITQAVKPPFGEWIVPQVTGQIYHTGSPTDELLVHLVGDAYIPIQPATVRFAASLVVDKSWNGKGTFTYGTHTISGCTVKKVGP